MGVGREMFESEKKLKDIWPRFISLNCCVWYGSSLLENAQEDVESIKKRLDEVIEALKKEPQQH